MTKSLLSDILSKQSDPAPTNGAESLEVKHGVQLMGISCEAVVGGMLMRLEFGGDTHPAAVKRWLLDMDPQAKVREDFPSKGSWGRDRETKTARVLIIQVKRTNTATFIDLVSQCDGEDFTISVTKKNVEGFGGSVKALGKLTPKSEAKLEAALSGKDAAGMVILSTQEHFGAKFWKSDDGKSFLDSVCADAPALAEAES